MLLECCDSSGLLNDSAVVSTKDGYYCGMTLVSGGKIDTTVTVTDGNGKVLAIVSVLAGPTPKGYRLDCPSKPIPALQGVRTILSPLGIAEYVIRYAETISGLKRA